MSNPNRFQQITEGYLALKYSDLSAGALDAGYEMSQGRKSTFMRLAEEIVYNVAGRKAMHFVGGLGWNLTDVNDSVEKDLFVGIISGGDSKLRKGKSQNVAMMDALASTLTSYLGRNLMLWGGINDEVIFTTKPTTTPTPSPSP